MRKLAMVLAAMLVLIQYPLWLGKGGWFRVWETDRQIVAQLLANDRLTQRNAGLEAEVRDLREGQVAIEERARYDLGMVRADEIFVQIIEPGATQQAPDSAIRTVAAQVPPRP